ncbi:protoheme IX farnesyltransferase [Sphingobacterium daejeonense]|nr:protoheme IX farnesyltransferase [Sphingobacterium daejeonense]
MRLSYTPLKQKSPIAVWVGAIPGALPPLIGYYAAFQSAGFGLAYAEVSEAAVVITPLVLFTIQFFWQFPPFLGYCLGNGRRLQKSRI